MNQDGYNMEVADDTTRDMTAPLPPISPRRPRSGELPALSPRPSAETEGLPPIPPRRRNSEGLPSPALRPLGADTHTEPIPLPVGRPPRRRLRRAGYGALAVLALGVAGASGAVTASFLDDAPATVARNEPTPPAVADSGLPLPDAISVVEPSVVIVRSGFSQGSGVVTSPRGLIVTNEHVVSDAPSVTVITADGRRIDAQVVSTDVDSDLAILRPAISPGPGVQVAQEPDGGLRQGDTVFAVGSPFGLQNTVTVGVVSSLDRRGDRGQPVVQTDTPINPGNSGGGLFDLRGRLVGVPTEIRSPVPGNVGIGFAVTSSRVRENLDKVP